MEVGDVGRHVEVGRRVSVRRRLPGGEEVGDLVGDVEAADAAALSIRARSGELVRVERTDVLAARVVPDPAREVGADELEQLAALGRRGAAGRAVWLTTDIVTIRARVGDDGPAGPAARVAVVAEATAAGVAYAVASIIDNDALLAVCHGALARHWLGLSAAWVAPGARRRGLASATVAALARWAGNARARHAYVVLEDGDAPALAFAAHLGFREHHRTG